MKNIFTVLFLSMFLLSCSNDDTSNSNSSGTVDVPLAKAEFDASNLGIYKGVFTGSSGVITINIKNDGAVNAKMIIDGVVHLFTTTESVSETGNISGLTFISGDMSFDLTISNNGENVEASALAFPGHPNATLNILKEYSDQLVRCYEGSFSGTASGVLNVITVDNFVSGLAYANNAEDAYFLNGTLSGTTLSGTYGSDPTEGNFSGTISGNNLSGTWQSINPDNPGSGTWTAQRTL